MLGSGLAWLILGVSVVASMWAMRVLIDANADRLIPYFSGAGCVPRSSIVLRCIAAVLLVCGIAELAPDLGEWSAAVAMLVPLPPMLWQRAHNRRLQAPARREGTD